VNKVVDNLAQAHNASESVSALWTLILSTLKEKSAPEVFETWFKPLELVGIKDGTFDILVPNQYFKEKLTHDHLPLLKEVFSQAGYPFGEVIFSVATSQDEKQKKMDSLFPPMAVSKPSRAAEPAGSAEPSKEKNAFLFNPKYTFDNFIVGDANRYAHAAGVAVAVAPAKTYNPLVIYGKSGLGKTHLMHAIGIKIKERNPSLKVALVTTEEFLNQMVSGIQSNKMEEFRQRYRRADVLLLDDIQILVKKEGLQNEMFHTFNALFDARKQVVASSDCPPRELRIEDRLRSRFIMGLAADIQPPDYETRLAILRKMAVREHFTAPVPDDVYVYIASKFRSNIRQLEGSFRKIVSMAELLHMDISVSLAEGALKDLVEPEQKPLSAEEIKKTVAAHFHLRPGEIESKKRTAHLAFPRQIAMYLIREMTELSFPETGQCFGGRDHTTVIYAVDQISKKMEADPSLNQLIQDFIKNLRSNSAAA